MTRSKNKTFLKLYPKTKKMKGGDYAILPPMDEGEMRLFRVLLAGYYGSGVFSVVKNNKGKVIVWKKP